MRANFSSLGVAVNNDNNNFKIAPDPDRLKQFNEDLKAEAGTSVYRAVDSQLSIVRICSERLGILYPFFLVKDRKAYQIEARETLKESDARFELNISCSKFHLKGAGPQISLLRQNSNLLHFSLTGDESSNLDYIDQLQFEPLPYRIRALAYHKSFGFICFCAEAVGAYPIRMDASLHAMDNFHAASLNLVANQVGMIRLRAFVGNVNKWREVLVSNNYHQSGQGVNNYRISCELGEFFFPSHASAGNATLTPSGGERTCDILDFEPERLQQLELESTLSVLERAAKKALENLGLLSGSSALQILKESL